MSEKRLDGKIAIVIGTGQNEGETIGNGRATALRFLEEGATASTPIGRPVTVAIRLRKGKPPTCAVPVLCWCI